MPTNEVWVFDASSVGAKVEEELTWGAELAIDYLFLHRYHKQPAIGAKMTLRVADTATEGNQGEIVASFIREFTLNEMLEQGYSPAIARGPKASEYLLQLPGWENTPGHLCPTLRKYFPNSKGPPPTLYLRAV